MSATHYERELKGILSADKQILEKITRARDLITATNYLKIEKAPFMVIRAAGSFGVDLCAIRADFSFPIEVKTSIHNVLRFGGTKNEEQAEQMLTECQRAGVMPIYAFRLKRPPKLKMDPWRIFTLETERLTGTATLLHNWLPKLRVTTGGNYVMEWSAGSTLSEFIYYLDSIR